MDVCTLLNSPDCLVLALRHLAALLGAQGKPTRAATRKAIFFVSWARAQPVHLLRALVGALSRVLERESAAQADDADQADRRVQGRPLVVPSSVE